MNELGRHLKSKAIRQADFAAIVGLSQPTVSKLCAGISRPSLGVALLIEEATGGKVPVKVWSQIKSPSVDPSPSTREDAE